MATMSVLYQNMLETPASTSIKIFQAVHPRAKFIQNATCTAAGIGIQNYGVAMIPYSLASTAAYTLEAELNGVRYFASQSAVEDVTLGSYLTMSTSL